MTNYNLDICTPEELPIKLRWIADQYGDSQSELSAAWQDEHAGKIWSDFATILYRAAESCDKALTKRGL
jgi:hypothetical protein